MGLTLRQTKGSALTIQELDANFEYFTGSHSVTGSVAISGSQQIVGSVEITGSLNVAGPVGSLNITGSVNISGSQNVNGPSTINGSLTSEIFIHPQLLTTNITIPAGYNGLLVSPVSNSGSITIGSGSNLVII